MVDGRGRPLVILLTAGQAGDAPMMLPLLRALRVQRPIGRPRTRPDRVLADKAYSSRAIRAHLRARGITSVIPEQGTQTEHRRRRGAAGGRPVTHDRTVYRARNVIERAFNGFKHWRELATRYDKHARAAVLHRFLTRTPAMLVAARLEDVLEVARRTNMPGCSWQQRPANWSSPLPVVLDALPDDPRVARVVAALRALI